MQRDIIFLIRDISEKHLVQSRNTFFMMPLVTSAEVQLKKDAEKIPPLKLFLDEKPQAKLFCAACRNSCNDEATAIEKAWNSLAGILDGFALVIDGNLPRICPVIQIREERSQHATIKIYGSSGWATIRPPVSGSLAKWDDRNEKLLTRFLAFFDAATISDSKYRNDLCYQLRYSAKMFRCGLDAHNFGVEYLCKFSALEGIVCGAIREKKRQTLISRLSSLFAKANRNIHEDIKKLWTFRNEASHQAKAFHDDDIPGSKPIHLEVVTIEYYLAGVFVFALDHIETAQTVEALWSQLAGYSLPDYALLERPSDMFKCPILNLTVNTPFVMNGVGDSIDVIYTSPVHPVAGEINV
jgi:hypothetical protein